MRKQFKNGKVDLDTFHQWILDWVDYKPDQIRLGQYLMWRLIRRRDPEIFYCRDNAVAVKLFAERHVQYNTDKHKN